MLLCVLHSFRAEAACLSWSSLTLTETKGPRSHFLHPKHTAGMGDDVARFKSKCLHQPFKNYARTMWNSSVCLPPPGNHPYYLLSLPTL